MSVTAATLNSNLFLHPIHNQSIINNNNPLIHSLIPWKISNEPAESAHLAFASVTVIQLLSHRTSTNVSIKLSGQATFTCLLVRIHQCRALKHLIISRHKTSDTNIIKFILRIKFSMTMQALVHLELATIVCLRL